MTSVPGGGAPGKSPQKPSAAFADDRCSVAVLAPGSTCDVSVVYAPASDASSDAAATLVFSIQDTTTASAVVTLSGILLAGDAGAGPVDAAAKRDAATFDGGAGSANDTSSDHTTSE